MSRLFVIRTDPPESPKFPGLIVRSIYIYDNLNYSHFSDPQGTDTYALLQTDEQKRRLHVAADLRDRRLQLEERRGAEHHLRQLRHQVSIYTAIYSLNFRAVRRKM